MPVATQLINNIVGNRLHLLTSNFAPYWVSPNLIFLASKKVIVKNEKGNIGKVLKMVAIFIIGFVLMLQCSSQVIMLLIITVVLF